MVVFCSKSLLLESKCPDGWYGSFCKNNCTCENSGTCDRRDGSCQCPGHYFGEKCQFPCNCENGATCLIDGTCSCTIGFYGPRCEFKCSCPVNAMCNRVSGQCVCKDGFFGPSCLPCNCAMNERCDPFDGRCSCKTGYYGESCEKRCLCFNGAKCINEDRAVCKCSDGWIGSDCTVCDSISVQKETFCEGKCLHCYNGNKCRVSSGDCVCTLGWQGDRCDQKCEEGYYGTNCSQFCECEHGGCNHLTGTCQCENGWTGHHCKQPCPDNCVICKGNTCISCKPGWTGVDCTNPCQGGFYGNGCKTQCPECYCTKTCHHIFGSCPNIERCENGGKCIEEHLNCECPEEWSGPVCNISLNAKVTNPVDYDVDDGSQTTLSLGVGFVSAQRKQKKSIQINILIGSVAAIIVVSIFTVAFVLTLIKGIRKRNADATVVATDKFQESMFSDTSDDGARNKQSQQLPSNGHTVVSLAVTVDDETDVNPYDIARDSDTRSPRIDDNGMTNAETENGENNAAMTMKDDIYANPYDISTNNETGSSQISNPHTITRNIIHERKDIVAHRLATCNNFSPTTDEFHEGPYAIVSLSDLHFNLGTDIADNGYDKLDILRYSKCQKQSHSKVQAKNGAEFQRLPSTDDAGYDSLSNNQNCEESTCLSSTDETEYDKLEIASEKTQIM
ncbi:protein draper-like [Ptychodera flava]|uniref:protein draper-like n=1 Tax=Ptychodera flava TaxID=63121 RepID=UPI00396A9B14